MPAVSIIVPVYKAEAFLRQSVDSILAQTFTDFELILVDDGSPDNCGIICDEYAAKDSRVKVIHQLNEGPSSARNAGIEAANGKYIYFADSDDFLDENLLSFCIAEMEKDDLDLLIFGADVFDSGGHHSKLVFEQANKRAIGSQEERLHLCLSIVLQYRVGWEPWNRLYLREIIEKNHIRFPHHVSMAEDLYFFLCYCTHLRSFKVIRKILYHYRLVNGSLMDQQRSRITSGQKNELCKQLADYYRLNKCNQFIEAFPAIYFRIITNMLQNTYEARLNSGSFQARRFHADFWDDIEDKSFFSSQIRNLPFHLKEAASTYTSRRKFAEDLSLLIFARTGFFFGFRVRNYLIRKMLLS